MNKMSQASPAPLVMNQKKASRPYLTQCLFSFYKLYLYIATHIATTPA